MSHSDLALPLRARMTVLRNEALSATSYCMRLAAPGWPGAEPGQFVMLSPGTVSDAVRFDPLLPRPMAVFRTGAGGGAEVWIEVLYKVSGRGTRLLADAREGDQVFTVGPLGRPFRPPDAGVAGSALLIGGGTGIASLFDLAAVCALQRPVHVLLGARTEDDLMAQDAFAALAGVRLKVATEDGSAGHRGRVTECLEQALQGGPVAHVYACGPTPMMERAAEIADRAGVGCTVSLENTMACGFGVCLGCAVPTRDGRFALVCRDGPVMAAERVSWSGLAG